MYRTANLVGTLLVGMALLAPVASADSPYDWPSANRPGGVAAHEAPVRPDDRPGPRGPGAFSPGVVVESADSGFDWRDATVGGVAGVGTALLVTGGAVLVLTQRRRPRPA
jgi:hypothetical protein